jgi:hypothetical protein
LAPEGCDTLTGTTRRRQEGSFEPGLGTSVGGIKPVLLIWFVLFIELIWFIWLVSFKQKTKQTKQTK